ncbi:hypothetical protein SPRG_09400 [Saprolegnia parasitica CBS 223.65]|uniref:Lipase maturation factor 2 n=1 Tax=Saprolegnia parasitica (strain CBS 223.65) TaxID=695850 RepID=A0A067CF59_SAPPC|nr:hypothetical protein SPRG_09400 [Saprolegnia parasitica CBS 223.65]KDO25457.1 hypothetical protein SPRG_09400 [Saprolegnia parasitica CBS 223.65]|eukprot:XP_012203883.1 hypothetical protein SPRG_09400 [Saprolegnia parasitica CBS 223.65]
MNRPRFLRTLGVLYGISFASIYVQIQSLYGPDGVEPVAVYLARLANATPDASIPLQRFVSYPSLVWFHDALGLSPDLMMEFLCLLGGGAAALAATNVLTLPEVFAAMWSCYLSLVLVGQSFLRGPWDLLLLEVGFLALFVAAPFDLATTFAPSAAILHAMRLLGVKVALMSSAAKITSACPTWLGLTALDFHYVTQATPLPSSWFMHQLPHIAHRVTAAAGLWIEGPVALLLVSPIARHRACAASLQLVLHAGIALTGNYGIFNLVASLVMVGILSEALAAAPSSISWQRWAVTHASMYLAVLAAGYSMFEVVYEDTTPTSLRFAWSIGRTQTILGVVLRGVLALALLSLVGAVAGQLYQSVVAAGHDLLRCRLGGTIALGHLTFTTLIGTVLVVASLAQLASVDPTIELPVWARNTGILASRFHVASTYGLFHRTPGVGKVARHGREFAIVARPTLVFEGSDDDGATWRALPFQHHPSSLYKSPAFTVPHLPRLAWQLDVAAKGNYSQAPWLVHLADKFLQGSVQAKQLLDATQDPFRNTPPQRVRVQLYHYDFTRYNTSWARATPKAVVLTPAMNASQWWTRKLVKEYMPALDAANPSVASFLAAHGWEHQDEKTPACVNSSRPVLCHALDKLHHATPAHLYMALVLGLVLVVLVPLFVLETPKSAALRVQTFA